MKKNCQKRFGGVVFAAPMTKPKKDLPPDQQVEQKTWSIRRPKDPRIRRMIATLMKTKKLNRSEAVLHVVETTLEDVLEKALAAERAGLSQKAQELDRLLKEYQRKP